VDLGGRNGSDAWIKSGVAAGTEVIGYPPSALRDGSRVSARSAVAR
jgi:HlyD family secretion protein